MLFIYALWNSLANFQASRANSFLHVVHDSWLDMLMPAATTEPSNISGKYCDISSSGAYTRTYLHHVSGARAKCNSCPKGARSVSCGLAARRAGRLSEVL